ncbi:hypothetical protein [Cellulomonas cellasea]|uniref:Glycosyltransferase RgtA/B/C/D-like domain-containing protein n=1 Tax=Cellulomonas cellasea TaxID=43670 RepID=A0A7W4UFX2_9CELL|nr:hypothetical protein [Cellulomonas cellasea]MBB2922880.1 hypothetical protein [Cellulomonas cellasea]
MAHVLLQAGMMRGWPGWNLSAFRNYFASDQMAYLSIARSVAEGESAFVEPFTLTGSIYYPRGYYVVIGTLARLTSTHPATMWTLCGLAAQVALVVAIGVTCVLLTRRWWTGVLGFLPFLLGTGGWLLDQPTWMRQLDSHAVLWGPFAVLYTLNGESVALALGGVAMLALLLVGARRLPRRLEWPVAIAACLLVGSLANIQTYSFLVSAYVVVACAAVVGLVRARSWVAAGITVALFAVVTLAGPVVADGASPLAVLVLGLAPALPGLLLLLRATGARLWWCAVAVAVGAAPQVLATVGGLLRKDDFLVYREASTKDLGVPLESGLSSGVWILPALLLVAWIGFRRRHLLWTALPLGLVTVWAWLSVNDRWGANQEPYRFWLDTYLVVTALTVPLLAWATSAALSRRVPDAQPSPAPGEADDDAARGDGLPPDGPGTETGVDAADGAGRRAGARAEVPVGAGPNRALVAVALVLAVVVAGISVRDFVLFRRDVTALGYIPLVTPRYEAVTALAERTDGALVLPDSCLDPILVKLAWGGPVAFFNMGLAWPDEVKDIAELLAQRGAGTVDPARAESAGVRWLIADASCALEIADDDNARLVATQEFTDPAGTVGTVELWEVTG